MPLQKKVEANQPLLSIKNLSIFFGEQDSFIKAVNQIDLTVNEGEIVGIVGESGSGKSVTMMAVMGLLGTKSMVLADYLRFRGQNLMKMTPSQKRKIVGKEMAMIFQDPMTSLNPTYTVGRQLMEVLEIHQGLRGSTLRSKAVELLKLVEIPSAEKRISQYPHELSGGMCQRVAIAMAIACQPKLLIADEPTTALDVTIQAQIMELLVSLQKKFNMSLILITHDLAVVAEIADRAIVMYSGEIVEEAELPQLFESPKHPYTEALLKAIPEHNEGISRLAALPGIVPPLNNRPVGCLLAERCAYAKPLCYSEHPNLNPLLITSKASNILNNKVRCFFPLAEKISFVEEITHAS
ncbi:ABC transporter ATP-binding protein [Thorsellia kenyensis]|uniref:ABC-type dipeptide transporter n=1 Tax=Thorsellia kenyensis TaxID=1549888 RepID=A0ABV6CDD7_9GAMM